MIRKSALIVIAALSSACSAEQAAPQASQPDLLENKVWAADDDNGGRTPGDFRVFLSNGVMIIDSCWETHRLAPWRRIDEDTILWTEDGADIEADIASLSRSDLSLTLKLVDETKSANFVRASAPYVCPDMPR